MFSFTDFLHHQFARSAEKLVSSVMLCRGLPVSIQRQKEIKAQFLKCQQNHMNLRGRSVQSRFMNYTFFLHLSFICETKIISFSTCRLFSHHECNWPGLLRLCCRAAMTSWGCYCWSQLHPRRAHTLFFVELIEDILLKDLRFLLLLNKNLQFCTRSILESKHQSNNKRLKSL